MGCSLRSASVETTTFHLMPKADSWDGNIQQIGQFECRIRPGIQGCPASRSDHIAIPGSKEGSEETRRETHMETWLVKLLVLW